MADHKIGVNIQGATPRETLDAIIRAEQFGVKAAWLTTGATSPDAMTLFAAVAVETRSIQLGTSIVPTYPRHPLVLAQQALVVADLAPGRFLLGVGPSHRASIEQVYGLPFHQPLAHLREYVTVLRQALDAGTVDFDGTYYHVHGQIENPPHLPILISALRTGSFRLAGEIADGAISWITPAAYLRDHALPALRQGASNRKIAGTPILVAHCFAAVTEDEVAALQVGRQRVGFYVRAPFYQEMFAAAGYPEARQGIVTDAMVRAVVASGDEAATARGIRAFIDAGADQVIVTPIPVGPNPQVSIDRTMRLLASM